MGSSPALSITGTRGFAKKHILPATGRGGYKPSEQQDVVKFEFKEGKAPDIHMMVLYTADVENMKSSMERKACTIWTETASLMGIPSEEWLEEIRTGIWENAVTDEVLMHLIILPLTYKGDARKQESIRECVELARQIQDKDQETFALAGILSFTDKVISEETRRHIRKANAKHF